MSVKVGERTLRSLLQERRPTPSEALLIVARICDALETFHAQGTAHGALCPENIVIAPAGGVTLTKTSAPDAYQAPEVTKRSSADPRADLYSLGRILYELLTGML